MELQDRFWAKVDRRGEDDCWEWQGASGRYGRIRDGDRSLQAHRVSYRLSAGEIPDGMHVLHSCDNPLCVNPAHLHLGTQADNLAEAAERSRTARGEDNGSSKLTAEEAREIRDSDATQRELAEEHGVSQTLVHKIQSGKLWGHINND